jgi:hypothetical protein
MDNRHAINVEYDRDRSVEENSDYLPFAYKRPV